MNTKFTKGEWLYRKKDSCIHDIERDDIVCCVMQSTPQDSANAHLIAAAPDMYKMIDDLTIELKHAIDEVNGSRMMQINSQTETPPDMWDMQSLHEAQLLLKKARGES